MEKFFFLCLFSPNKTPVKKARPGECGAKPSPLVGGKRLRSISLERIPLQPIEAKLQRLGGSTTPAPAGAGDEDEDGDCGNAGSPLSVIRSGALRKGMILNE